MKRPDFTFNGWQDLSDELYKALPEWLAFIASGYLWGLEQRYIGWKARKAVDDAILPHIPPPPVIEPPRPLREPSEVDGLDTIGFTYDFMQGVPRMRTDERPEGISHPQGHAEDSE